MDQVVGFADMDWVSGVDYLSLYPELQKHGKHPCGQISQKREQSFVHSLITSKAPKDGSLDALFSNVMPADEAQHTAEVSLDSCSSIDNDMLAYLFPQDTNYSETLSDLASNHVNVRKQLTASQILEPFSRIETPDAVVVPEATQASRLKPHLGSGQDKVANPTVQQAMKVASLHPSVEVLARDMSYSSASSSVLQPQKCQSIFPSPDSLPTRDASAMNFACFSRPAAIARANLQTPSMRNSTTEIQILIAGSEEPTQSPAFPSGTSNSSGKQAQYHVPSSQGKGSMASDALTNRTTDAGCHNQDLKQGIASTACSNVHGDKISSSSAPEAAEAMDPSSTTSLGDSPNAAKNWRRLATKRKTLETENRADSKCVLHADNESHEIQKPARGRSRRSRAAEVHNLSERRRRDRINEKMKALQKLIPNSNKTDKASMLDEAIEYLKMLQSQLQYVMQMISIRNGMTIPVIVPAGQEQLQVPPIAHIPNIRMGPGLGMGMEMQLGLGMRAMVNNGYGWHSSPSPFSGSPHTPLLPPVSLSDSHKAYLSPAVLEQFNTKMNQQPLQPVNLDVFQAYILSQQQSQQSHSQQLHRQVQQQPSGSFFRSS